jgi:hypothetical protein
MTTYTDVRASMRDLIASLRATLVALDTSVGDFIALYQEDEPELADWKARKNVLRGSDVLDKNDRLLWLRPSGDFIAIYECTDTDTYHIQNGYTEILDYDYTATA